MWESTVTSPDIANAVRTMVNIFDSPGQAHRKELLEILPHLLRTFYQELKWRGVRVSRVEMSAGVNFDHTTYFYSRHSVPGRVVQLSEASIAWSSRKQQAVALSSSEAEHTALPEITKKFLWLHRVEQLIRTNVGDTHYGVISVTEAK